MILLLQQPEQTKILFPSLILRILPNKLSKHIPLLKVYSWVAQHGSIFLPC